MQARRWLAAAALLILALLPQSHGQAAPADVQIEISPNTVQLAAGDSAEVLVIVRNVSASALQSLELRWFSDTGITAQIDAPHAAALQPGGTLAWTVHITQAAGGRMAGAAYFQVHYSQTPAGSAQAVPGIAAATLAIQERPADAVSQIAQARVETTLNQLEEPRQGLIFLVVQNLTSTPITLTQLAAQRPDFIALRMPEVGAGQVIAPQASLILPISVTVTGKPQTGMQRLLFELGLAWVKGGRPGSGSLVVGHTITVGILGESGLLQLVGVPSFLFLPGFLILSTFVLLWSRVAPKQQPQAGLSASEFTLISITLSLVAALAYPVLTGLAGEPSNYLQGYSLQDVFSVWFGSVAAGALAWMAVSAYRSIRQRLQKQAEARRLEEQAAEAALRAPAETDSPIQALQKMALNGVDFPLQQASLSRGGVKYRCFIILDEAAGRPLVWLAPPIVLKSRRADAPADWPERLQQAAGDQPEALASVLEKAQADWETGWGAVGPIAGPIGAEPQEVTRQPDLPPRLFIELA